MQVCQRVVPPVFPLQVQWPLQSRRLIILLLPQVHLLHQLWLCHATVRIEQRQTCAGQIPMVSGSSSHVERKERGDSLTKPTKNPKPKKKKRKPQERTGWPVVFWNPGVAARIQRKFGGWWNSWTRRLTRQFFSWSVFRAHIQGTWGFVYKHCAHTHFPEDRNCEICQRTKITRAPCKRRNGGAVPRAENFVTW